MKLGEFLSKDSIAMLFLQTAYISLVSGCKITQLFPYNEKKVCFKKKTKHCPHCCILKKVQFHIETAPLKFLEISRSTLVAISIRELPLRAMSQFGNVLLGRV